MALLASDVKLMNLGGFGKSDPMQDILTKRKASLQSALGRIGQRATTSAAASGRTAGEYAPRELETAGTMGERGISDALYGVLGAGSLKEAQAEKEHQASLALARAIGSKAAPNLAATLLSSLGGVGQTALTLSPYFRKTPNPLMTNPSGGSKYGLGMPNPSLAFSNVGEYRYPSELRVGGF